MRELKLKKKFLYFLTFFILIFFLIEIFLRIFKIEYPIFQKHDTIRGFSLLPNSYGTWRREGEGIVKINSDGLRDFNHEVKKSKNTIRLAVLGDSFAEARAVNINDTFWFKLKKNLKECNDFHNNKNIEVINFGVSEYGTTQQYLTLKHEVWKYDPDIIILAFFSGNDIADNLKELSKKKYRPYFLFKNELDFEIDKSYLNSKPYKTLSSFYGQIFIKFSQYSRISQLFREAYVQSYFKKQRNKKNVKKKQIIINDSNLYNPKNLLWSNAWITTEKIIKLINNDVLKNDKKFILVSLTNPIQVNPEPDKLIDFKKKNNILDIFYPEMRLEEFSRINSINYIQLAKKMRKIALDEKVYFHGFNNTRLGTGHWNKKGHETASKLISNEICKLY